MTKEDVIEILERFVLGAKPCSQIEIIDACASAYRMLQEQPSLPSNLDEAAEEYSENILANNEDLQDAIEDAYKTGGMLVAWQFQKIEGELVDWYSTSEGKDYCCGIKTSDPFVVPEGFYIRKKQ